MPVRVNRIRYSDCFEVVDGNHRLALASARGDESYPAAILPVDPAVTPVSRWSWIRPGPTNNACSTSRWICGSGELDNGAALHRPDGLDRGIPGATWASDRIIPRYRLQLWLVRQSDGKARI
jgi:hypothetical protein